MALIMKTTFTVGTFVGRRSLNNVTKRQNIRLVLPFTQVVLFLYFPTTDLISDNLESDMAC